MATWTGSRAASQTKKSNGNTGSGTATCRWLEAGASVGDRKKKKEPELSKQVKKKESKKRNYWLVAFPLTKLTPPISYHSWKEGPPSSSSLSLLLFLVPLHFPPPARSSSQTHANPNPGPLFETFENSNKNRGGQSGQFYPCRAYFPFFFPFFFSLSLLSAPVKDKGC